MAFLSEYTTLTSCLTSGVQSISTQIDGDVAHRYRENLWLLLTGTANGTSTESTYSFCRDVIGYDLADFFQRYSPRIKTEVEAVLKALLSPS